MMKYLAAGLFVPVVTGVATFGAPAIEIAAGPGDLAGEFAAGQVVSVPLYATSACDAGVFGVELALLAASYDVVIRGFSCRECASRRYELPKRMGGYNQATVVGRVFETTREQE